MCPTASARAREKGFTLLELLVALAIFALVSAMAYAGLARLVEARRTLAAEQERLGQLLFALTLFERDCRSMLSRPVRDGSGARQAALVGGASAVEWTLLIPEPGGGASVSRVAYKLEGGEWVVERFPFADRAFASPRYRERLLAGLSRLEFRYLDHEGRWRREWPAGDERLPRALEIVLSLEGLGELRRVLAVGGLR